MDETTMQAMQGALIAFGISLFLGLMWLFQKKLPRPDGKKQTSTFSKLLPLISVFGMGYGVLVGFPKFAQFLKTDVRTVQREAFADALHGWPSALDSSGSKQRVMPLGIPFVLELSPVPGQQSSRRSRTVEASILRFDQHVLNFYSFVGDEGTRFCVFFGVDENSRGEMYEGYWADVPYPKAEVLKKEQALPLVATNYGRWFIRRLGNTLSGQAEESAGGEKRTWLMVLAPKG